MPVAPSFEFGSFRLDPGERRLLRGDEVVTLTPKAFDVLVVLIRSGGRLVTKDELLKNVWADTCVEEGNLSYTISLLRKALSDDGECQRIIETVPKAGYRIGIPVKSVQHTRWESVGRPDVEPRPRTRGAQRVWWVIAGASGLLIAMVGAMIGLPTRTRPASTRPPSRFDVVLPKGFVLSEANVPAPAVSPDGKRLALIGTMGGHRQIWVRPLDATTLMPLPGTDGAVSPFWSPDSRRIGFFAGGALRTIDAAGGPVLTLCKAPMPNVTSGTWNRDGVILFTAADGRIARVSERGGPLQRVTGLDAAPGERFHSQPFFLPDGRRYLFVQLTRDNESIYAGSLDSPEVHLVEKAGSQPHYAAGHLMFLRQQTLMTVPIDPTTLQARGMPTPIADLLAWRYSVAESGMIVALSGDRRRELTWYRADEGRQGVIGQADRYLQVEISPSGTRAALMRNDQAGSADLWLFDLADGTMSLLARGSGAARGMPVADPVWSPDERYLAFTSRRTGGHMVLKDLASGREEPFEDFPDIAVVDDWTPDGRFIVFRARGVFARATTGGRKWHRLYAPDYMMDQLQVSPDSRWVAFNSMESHEWEVYVARFPEWTDKVQVSKAGGVQPRWRHDGRALFYLGTDGTMMAVDIDPARLPRTGRSRALFRSRLSPSAQLSQYDAAKDERVLILEPELDAEFLTVLLDWTGHAGDRQP